MRSGWLGGKERGKETMGRGRAAGRLVKLRHKHSRPVYLFSKAHWGTKSSPPPLQIPLTKTRP
jgi:hypothetical protein